MTRLGEALDRARRPILWVAMTYGLAVVAGMLAVHLGSRFALAQADRLVAAAGATDPAAISLSAGQPWRAALFDFLGNLGRGAVPSTIMGLAVVLPFPFVAYRGWVGGIVSVDAMHASRLTSVSEATYYFSVLLLQLIPYSLAGGAGVRLGLGFLWPHGPFAYASRERWVGLPAEGVRDVLLIYAVAVPLFALASTVEFVLR